MKNDFHHIGCECTTVALSSISLVDSLQILENCTYTICKVCNNTTKKRDVSFDKTIDIKILYLILHKNSQIAWLVITPVNKIESLAYFFSQEE